MSIQIRKTGRRYYLVGNTYPYRATLKSFKAHWDSAARAWWIGSQNIATQIVDQIKNQASRQQESETVSVDAPIIRGRCRMVSTSSGKTNTYYILAHGISKKTGREYYRLCFRDGSVVFWAQHPESVSDVKLYQRSRSIAQLKEYAENYKRDRFSDDCRCRCHHEYKAGAPGSILYDGCERCGCESP